jgi:hypothetical protein
MKNKKISHVEIYYTDSSMDKISNEKTEDIKFTKKQLTWIRDECLNELNNFKTCYAKKESVTIKNYNTFKEDDFSDIPHSEYQMMLSLLDTLSVRRKDHAKM